MDKVAIFIDGGYFSKAIKAEYKEQVAVDFSKLIEFLAQGMPILRTYYYNCMPYKSRTPTEAETERFKSMQRFIDSIDMLDRFDVRLGKLEYRGRDINGKPIFQQKRVDILLGCDLVLLSAKQRIAKAILVTGDSDFIPAIEVAKGEGVEIELAYTDTVKPHESLIRIADVRRSITIGDIEKVKLY